MKKKKKKIYSTSSSTFLDVQQDTGDCTSEDDIEIVDMVEANTIFIPD